MNASPARIDKHEYLLMRDYLEKSCGIHVAEDKTYLFETRLTAIMVEQGCTNFSSLHARALADKTLALRDKIVEAMTTTETLWFRDVTPFTVLEEVLFPAFADEIRQGKRSKIRIWCAASSTGQEPYSIAMSALEFCRRQTALAPQHLSITATDVSAAVLYIAKNGRYDDMSIARGLPVSFRDRYFSARGKYWEISDAVKNLVDFKKFNLQDSFVPLGRFDIVFCRNVLIYFAEPFKREIVGRIGEAVRPSGHLFLGASEALLNVSSEFDILQHRRGLYYRIKQSAK